MTSRLLPGCLAVLLVTASACSDDGSTSGGSTTSGSGGGSTTASTSGSGGATSGTGGGVAGVVPDPGNVMNGEWVDTEPNDTPAQAVPMGILSGPIWAGFTEPYTAINPEDDVDYFVFKTGPDTTNVYMSLCWSFNGNLLDMNLYEVVDQQVGALVKASTSTQTGCETLIDIGQGATELQPDTTYLLEVAGGPGLMLNGDPGLYSA